MQHGEEKGQWGRRQREKGVLGAATPATICRPPTGPAVATNARAQGLLGQKVILNGVQICSWKNCCRAAAALQNCGGQTIRGGHRGGRGTPRAALRRLG